MYFCLFWPCNLRFGLHHLLREKNILDECHSINKFNSSHEKKKYLNECKSINSLLVIFFRILFSCLSLLVISSKRKYSDGVSYLLIRCGLIWIIRSVMLVGVNPAYRKLKYFEVHNTHLCITCDGYSMYAYNHLYQLIWFNLWYCFY